MNPSNFIGKVVGSYQIKREIGEGAYSLVFLAEEIIKQISTEKVQKPRYIACKIIPREKNCCKKNNKRFDQEIRIHQLMHHPNVVQLIDVQKDASYYYVFLEYCVYGELFEYVIKKGKLNEIECANFFKQLLTGLQYIHSLNVSHRDLKPENILIDHNGQIKISDFGLSKLLRFDCKGYTKTPCGSPCYSSPELLSGSDYDARKSDIWSCGVILYTISTGFLPWTKRDEPKLFEQIKRGDYNVPSDVPLLCADLIRKMMTVDASKRISLCDALNHPFLRNVNVSEGAFDRKFVSLRKIDELLESDEPFEYNAVGDNIKMSNSIVEENFLKVRKEIKSCNERK